MKTSETPLPFHHILGDLIIVLGIGGPCVGMIYAYWGGGKRSSTHNGPCLL